MFTAKSLSINGYKELVPNTFYQQNEATGHGVIILPGLGYTPQMPLLYYSTNVMLSLKADVLAVEYAYNRSRDFKASNEEERTRWILGDIRSAFQALLEQRSYKQITMIGKSLGTKGMGYLLTTATIPAEIRAVWLTPLLKDNTLLGQIIKYGGRSLFVCGSADPHYDAAHMQEAQKATMGQVVLIDGADHLMNIKDDAKRSIQALENIIESIKTFVSR